MAIEPVLLTPDKDGVLQFPEVAEKRKFRTDATKEMEVHRNKATLTEDAAPLMDKSLGGALFLCLEWGKVHNFMLIFRYNYSIVNKMPRNVAFLENIF